MKRISFGLILLLLLGCVSCHTWERKRQKGAAVELNGQLLMYSTLDSLTVGLSGEDSSQVAERYIAHWAKDILLYDKAKNTDQERIEALVEDYRRSLHVQAYEEQLVERRMSKEVTDSAVATIYKTHADRLILRESIVRGLLMVVPSEAPEIEQIHRWMEELNEENLENIEKYAYRYASAYELFTDHWMTAQQLLLYMPFQKDEINALLKRQDHIVLTDSIATFILQVTDKHLVGDTMPMDYARQEIEKLILSWRRVEFLQTERQRLYEEAVRFKKIQFYEKE